MSLYRKILKNSLVITWRNKYLWFFGLFAALLGNGGEYEILIRGIDGEMGQTLFPGLGRIAETGVFSGSTITNIGQLLKTDPVSMIIVLVVGVITLALLAFLVWLTIVSQVALVNNSAEIVINEKRAQALGIRDGIISGQENFWPALGLNVVIKLIIYVAFIIIGLPALFTTAKLAFFQPGGVNLLYGILFIIFVPVAIALSFMIKYAIAYVVIKGSGFVESIRQGWRLFIENWLISLEMAFVLFFINFLVGLAIIMVILILAIPFLLLIYFSYKLFALAGFWLIATIGLITALLIIVLGGAALATFQIASWTHLFIELVNKGGTSKIERLVGKLKK